MYANKDLDITWEVINGLNEQYKKERNRINLFAIFLVFIIFMGFATAYLNKQDINEYQILTGVDHSTGFFIVIPCYNENLLLHTLDSLWNCTRPSTPVLVLIVVNSPEDAPAATIEQNIKTLQEAGAWISAHKDDAIRFELLYYPLLPRKFAGAGLARKIGMNTAVAFFNEVEKPEGVIVSLDADCLVESNYLRILESDFYSTIQLNVPPFILNILGR
ncbi:MAG: hypothetical protein HC906_14470 [Bacteroidales bacterium]|nr:hypothetical protein [Bacteroidales bacterium]